MREVKLVFVILTYAILFSSCARHELPGAGLIAEEFMFGETLFTRTGLLFGRTYTMMLDDCGNLWACAY